jgi:hypothetical protein
VGGLGLGIGASVIDEDVEVLYPYWRPIGATALHSLLENEVGSVKYLNRQMKARTRAF